MFENCKNVDELIQILKTIRYDESDKTLLRLAITNKIVELNGNINDVMRCANALEL